MMMRFSSILQSPNEMNLPQHSHKTATKFCFPSTTFLSSKRQYARFSALRNEPGNTNPLKVETISKELIKPMTPTPRHSRTYEVSFLDQLFPHFYVPFVYFYPNNHKNDSPSINHADVILKRRQLLKQSLSETLTRFYPLAGRIKNSTQINCNDDGVYYVEAKVSDRLSDFLDKPDNKSIHRLLPLHPNSMFLHFRTDLVMVQVTSFSCGGIAIGLYTSHKILDGHSMAIFFKGWASTARASPELDICPSFIAPSIFPSNPALSGKTSFLPIFSRHKIATKRVVFPASSLATLKRKGGSSRVTGVVAFLLKCVMSASKTSGRNPKKYTSLRMAVNLRVRSSPPMPPHCMGNIFWNSYPIQFRADEEDLGLDSIVQRIKKSTDKINGDLVEEMKGERFLLNLEKQLKELKTVFSDGNGKHVAVSSICNTGMYETDFGWGKPIWLSCGFADCNIPILENLVFLMDTRSENGIEAWVFLAEHEMAVFERDPELLALASLDPSPLQIN